MEMYEVFEVRPGVEVYKTSRPFSYERTENYSLHEKCNGTAVGDGRTPGRGRVRRPRRCSPLTGRQRDEIRRRYRVGDITQAELAKAYGVTQPLVSQIIRGK